MTNKYTIINKIIIIFLCFFFILSAVNPSVFASTNEEYIETESTTNIEETVEQISYQTETFQDEISDISMLQNNEEQINENESQEPEAGTTEELIETSEIIVSEEEILSNISTDKLQTKETEAETATEPEPESKTETEYETETETTVAEESSIQIETDETFMPVEQHLFYNGNGYTISVNAPLEANIPNNSSLLVEEIVEKKAYDYYVSATENVIGCESGSIEYARFFNISIIDEKGNLIQPDAQVNVDIQIQNTSGNDFNVVHFGDSPEILDADTIDDTISFSTNGFSVYAVIDIPEEVSGTGWTKLNSIEALQEYSSYGIYIAHPLGYYFTNNIIQINSKRTGIEKTTQSSGTGVPEGAVPYYFEFQSDNEFNVYCFNNNNEKQYVKLTGNSLNFSSESEATLFTIEPFPQYNNNFRIFAQSNGITYYWNMQGGTSGKSFAAYNSADDTNARICFYVQFPEEDDPYDLNGKSFGLIYAQDNIKGIALTNQEFLYGNTMIPRLRGETLIIRDNVVNQEGLFVVADEDITEWTFENITSDKYYLKTIVDNATKYLTINGNQVTLQDIPTENSVVTVKAGINAYAGEYSFSVNGYALNLFNGNATYGFGAMTSTNDQSWLNFVEKTTEISEDDFVKYAAKKVDVSDTEKLQNGAKVALYVRKWNPQLLQYEYYIVDYNGRMIKGQESGDTITWLGNKINTATWNFTEYYYEGTNTPNYYYELQNLYSEQYLAPKISDAQILSNEPIGINLLGRRYGDAYSSILAWDDPYYDYAGYKVVDNHIVSCPMSQSDEFYFAIIENYENILTTVETVDNNDYGITMKMVDFNGLVEESRNKQQTTLLGYDSNGKGLVYPYLENNGYPLTDNTVTGQPQDSLSFLFNNLTTVNHLFSSATYAESGYFEYDSTQNSAYLGNNTDFTVYDQLITMPGGSTSLNHGQFMPYNSIIDPNTGEPRPFSTTHFNTNSTTNEALPDSNPRKGEKLYEIPKLDATNSYPAENVSQPYKYADYFFGMEMDVSFTQTPNGLDAWNHDIIFEFSGDDDMWLYVDGRLILDIGGVHSASTGTVNFRTGEVNLIVKNAQNKVLPERTETTNLRTLFERSYRTEHPSATDSEVKAFLNEYFKSGTSVFKDYSKHDMRMFYMERGASASNLHMKFNLTFIKENTVILSKNVSGTDKQDYNFAEFPFQIYYKTDHSEIYTLLEQDTTNSSVLYQGTNTPVKYKDSFAPTGSTVSYSSVYFLKAGQYAEIVFPENTEDYYIVECGINNTIYDNVSINGVSAVGEPYGNRFNYSTTIASLDERPRIDFDNHVNPNALRTFTATKKLYKEDGVTELTEFEDNTTFSFRISLGNENDDNLTLCNMFPYHVKNPSQEYCKWDYATQKFVSLGDGKTDFSLLSEEEKIMATFTTSANGSISKIPANYSIELRDLLIGTKFKIEERADEIPEGYKLMNPGYVRVQGSYIIEDGDSPNAGTIRDNSDPAVEIRNQRGWSLTAQKNWSDSDYTQLHKPIYLAVYNVLNNTLVSDVKELKAPNTSVKFYFDNLESGVDYENYHIREVVPIGDFAVNEGIVTGYLSLQVLNEEDTVSIEAIPNGENDYESFNYEVHYEQGFASGANSHVRTDVVSNIRSGIKILKTDLNNVPLVGAVFTLTDILGNNIGANQYISDSNGLVTIAYLNDGEYILKEISSPKGYTLLTDEISIVKSGSSVSVSSDNPDGYEYLDNENMPTIIVKNKPFDIAIVKKDRGTNTPMQNVHFSLHRQVMGSSGPTYDYFPINGYADMITDENGLLNVNLNILPAGTYYIKENKTLSGFTKITTCIEFVILPTGHVEFASHPNIETQQLETDEYLVYNLTIFNDRTESFNSITVTKTVSGTMGDKFADFNFILTLSDTSAVTYTKGTESGTVVFSGNEYHFTLKHGESITFEHVPTGANYTVVESDANKNGYTTTITGNSEGLLTTNTIIEFKNNKNVIVPTRIRLASITNVLIMIFSCVLGIFIICFKKHHK